MGLDSKLGEKFAAVPIHSPVTQRQGLDPRLAKQFLKGRLTAEERGQLVQYIATSKWTPESRAIYSSVVDGFSTPEQISTVTGLSMSEVQAGIRVLERLGQLRRTT